MVETVKRSDLGYGMDEQVELREMFKRDALTTLHHTVMMDLFVVLHLSKPLY